MCVCGCVSVCVCGHVDSVQNHIAHLLTFAAADVQWQNKDAIAASIDFIYKGDKRKGVCLHVVCTQQAFDYTTQRNNETNLIAVNYDHAHTYICHRKWRSQGSSHLAP